MTLASAMVLIDQTAVPLTLPAIATDIRISTQLAQWVLNGSLLPLAGVLVLGGRLGDLFGQRKMFLIGSVLFAAASAAAGLAPQFGVLLGFRVLQGIGGALMLPNTAAIVSAAYLRKDQGRALGTMGGAAAVAGAALCCCRSPLIGPLVTAAAAGVGFFVIALLGQYPNYLGATVSQAVAGMAEMGLGIIFPLVLILNLTMDPVIAGLALIPATLPMIVVARLAGRWYDSDSGRIPLVTGFGLLAASGVLLALGVLQNSYAWILPGLIVYGIGLALVLTVNDPVSLDTVPHTVHGQASGVSATAEQFGGALGIALLYLVFHTSYLNRFAYIVANGPVTGLSPSAAAALKAKLLGAESTGLHPASFGAELMPYLRLAREASNFGYMAAFLTVTALSVIALVAVARLVRQPASDAEAD
ncbi:MFS transporter [Paeniglutamicibacter antarcticus]|uniref:MFS transporter n=1 Tax=Arthrobacter terrae TaxID=2935737 RepID=A0A931CSJ3_9MICC|nr:MFS transporter [Arthrobacter terrae]MBG0740124.1 MFS transporter [Arthrobacter terrae]